MIKITKISNNYLVEGITNVPKVYLNDTELERLFDEIIKIKNGI